jgi:hypothetical protein
MEDNKQRQIDIQNLKRFPEFYALKVELEAFCDKMDSIEDIDLSDVSRVTLEQEVYGRRWASQKVRDLLSTLGLVDKRTTKKDMTME